MQAFKTYFGKTPSELKLHESALLAGLPQAPSSYSPHINPKRAKVRRDQVLQRMFEEEYITEKELNASIAKPITVLPPVTTINAPHFVFEVTKLLEQEYGEDLLKTGGLKITTTLDLAVQEMTEEALVTEFESLERYNVTNGAVLVTRPPTGEIIAMVGSLNYFDGDSGAFNVVTAGTRQPGSSIKPINYAIGIDRKLVTASTMFLNTSTLIALYPLLQS